MKPPLSFKSPSLRNFGVSTLIIALTASSLLTQSAQAVSDTWTGVTDATWATGTNWLAGNVPGTGDTATFNSAGGAVDVIDLGAGVSVGTIAFDTAATAAYTIGAGAVNSQTLTLDNTGGVTMSATVAANQLVNANVILGTAAVGTTSFTNASTTNSLTIAGDITGGVGGTAGIKTINVSTLNGGGVVFQGTINAGGATQANVAVFSGGVATFSGTGTSNLTTFRVTGNSSKILVTNGTINVSAASTFGGSGSTAIGQFEMSGGTVNYNSGLSFNNSSGSGGLLRVTGGTFTAANASFNRGFGSSSETATTVVSNAVGFVVTGGTANITGALSINGGGSSNTALVDGGALTVGGQVTIANSTTDRWYRMQVSSGSFTSTDTVNGIVLTANAASLQKAALNLFGGTTTAEKISFGLATTLTTSQGQLNLNGATASLYMGSGGIVQNAASGYTSTINLINGLLGAKADWASSLNMNLNGAGVTIKAADVSNVSHDITLSGILSGSNGFTKTGGGTLNLNGANTYTGATIINGGALALGSAGTIGSTQITVGSSGTYNVSAVSGYTLTTGKTLTNNGIVTGALTVASGATLNGSGTFNGLTTVNGALNPGNSPGLQTYTNGLTLGSGSTTTMEIAGVGVAGTAYDSVNVSGGTLTLGGTLNIIAFGGYDPSVTASYNLFDGTTTGDFAAVNAFGIGLTNTAGTWTGVSGVGSTYTFTQSDGILNVVAAAVPEPSALLLGGLGALALLRRRRVA